MPVLNEYASIRTRAARVRFLRAQGDHVSLHVRISLENSHLGRLLIDGPRRLLPRLGEPGDRGVVHCFFDEEALYGEIADAGFRVVGRDGFTFELARGAAPAEDADAFALELMRAARLVRIADEARKGSPAEALASMRTRGVQSRRVRGPIGRARLRRAIGWVDALAGASCYRRILLESALDVGAAHETVVFGLDVGKTGHVAFEGLEDRSFDVAFRIPP